MPKPRTTNRMKVLNGTDRPDRMRPEPELPRVGDVPPAPDWLVNPEAVSEWEHKAGLMTEAGTLTEDNLSALAHYCNVHGTLVMRWRLNDRPTASDLAEYRRLAGEFGFTPASRSKAGGGVKKSGDGNPFEKLGKKAG